MDGVGGVTYYLAWEGKVHERDVAFDILRTFLPAFYFVGINRLLLVRIWAPWKGEIEKDKYIARDKKDNLNENNMEIMKISVPESVC